MNQFTLPARSIASDILMMSDRAASRFPSIAIESKHGASLLLDGSVMPVPHIPHFFFVANHSVDTEQLTCSCPDFPHSPDVFGRRLCKHLFAALLWEATH